MTGSPEAEDPSVKSPKGVRKDSDGTIDGSMDSDGKARCRKRDRVGSLDSDGGDGQGWQRKVSMDSDGDKASVHSHRSDTSAYASELPDLTKKLVQAGIYEEYVEYRDNYRKWRKGGHHGARGEVSDVVKHAEQKDHAKFEAWFPTPQKFHFFFTASYWGAILSLEGSLFFTLSSALLYVRQSDKVMLLMGWCNLLGGSIFCASVYCFYLQLINLQDAERVYLFPSFQHWSTLLQRVRWDSLMGTMTYVVSSLVYQVVCFLVVLPDLGLPKKTIPLLSCLGGFGFMIGGFCEVSHTLLGSHGHGIGLSSVVALLNCLGGIGFFLGGAAELVAHHYSAFIHFNYLLGSALYSVASAFLLVMWECNDFGGSLLDQLNHSICTGNVVNIKPEGQEGMRVSVDRQKSISVSGAVPVSPSRRLFEGCLSNLTAFSAGEAHKTKLSLRGALSLCVYAWLFVCTCVNFVSGILLLPSGRHTLSDVAMVFIWLLAVKLILVVHSAIATVPNEQPYRFAMQSMSFLLLCAAAIQTVILVTEIPLLAGPAVGHGIGSHSAGPVGAGNGTQPFAAFQQPSHGGEL